MTEKQRLIIDFLKNSNVFQEQDGYKAHYTLRQINIFSGGRCFKHHLDVRKKEMTELEKLGVVGHYYFPDIHETCYYAK